MDGLRTLICLQSLMRLVWNLLISKERFICYGSALRRGDVSFFSSLAKLFVIQKEENGRMKLWMDGQPKMNAGFRSEKRPKAVVREWKGNSCSL